MALNALKAGFVPSRNIACLLQSHSLWCAKNAAKKDCSLLWSKSKPRTLNSIFTIEYRFLWKGQSIFKSWMDILKVIYDWLIFRNPPENPTQEYFPDLLNFTLIRTWLNFHSLNSYLSSVLNESMGCRCHVELRSSATLIEMIYFYGKTASLR